MSHKGDCRHDDPAMCGCHSRTHGGLMRRVRIDKTAAHIEKQYGIKLPGRSDKKLKTILSEFKMSSQTQLLKKLRKQF